MPLFQSSQSQTRYSSLLIFSSLLLLRIWYALGLKKKQRHGSGGMVKRKGKKMTFGSDGAALPASNRRNSDKVEEEDYLDASDEEASAMNQDKAFVYVGPDGKLIYVPHENDQVDNETEEEEGKEQVKRNVNMCVNDDEMKGDEEAKENEKVEKLVDSTAADTVLLEKCDVKVEGEEDHVQQQEKRECLYATMKEEQSSSSECPLPRIRHALAMRGSTIYVFGGLLEIKEREYTLDDCWALDLRTR